MLPLVQKEAKKHRLIRSKETPPEGKREAPAASWDLQVSYAAAVPMGLDLQFCGGACCVKQGWRTF